ncbi:MAG: sugar ABC transporter permease, partial [Anaerolineae bacterium]|nr:sugar ABC transporter permease [Anaerolineae bacterium]
MHGWGRKAAPYLFISPFFIGYAIFFLLPVALSLRLSFFKQDGVTSEPRFIGFNNYERLLKDDLFIQSLLNTTYYALGSLFIIVPLALGLALLLSIPRLRFREFFRLFFFTPNITSGVVIGIIFGLVFNEQYGLINNFLLMPLGIEPVRWLRDPNWVMPSIIILGVWKFTGINALYFMVGLQNISPDYKEAARVDGASRWQVFRHITLPLLRPVLAFVLTFAIIGSYNLFAEPTTLVGNNGGPNNAGLTMTMH